MFTCGELSHFQFSHSCTAMLFFQFHYPLGSAHASDSNGQGVDHDLLEKETEPHLREDQARCFHRQKINHASCL